MTFLLGKAERFKGVAAISHSAFVYAAMVAAVEFLGCVGLQSFPPARCLFLPSVCLVHFILLSHFDHVMRAHLPSLAFFLQVASDHCATVPADAEFAFLKMK